MSYGSDRSIPDFNSSHNKGYYDGIETCEDELYQPINPTFCSKHGGKFKTAAAITFFVVTFLASLALIPGGFGIIGIVFPGSGVAVFSAALTNAGIFALTGGGGVAALLFFVGGAVTTAYLCVQGRTQSTPHHYNYTSSDESEITHTTSKPWEFEGIWGDLVGKVCKKEFLTYSGSPKVIR